MPTVPRYNSQINDSAGPSLRRTAPGNQSAFGLGTADIASKAIDTVTKIKNDADQIEATNAFTERTKRIETIKYDPDVGYMSKQGRNAIDGYQSTIDAIKSADDEIIKKYNLSGNKLEMYSRLRDRDDIQTQSQLGRHLSGERRRYDDDTQKAFIKTETDSAILNFRDEQNVNYRLENIEGAIMAYGQRNGSSPEEISLQRQMAKSGIRSGVITQFINSGDDRGAQAYFEQHKNSFTAQDTEKLQKILEIGNLRGESQRLSDKIFAESPTLGQAIEKVRRIDDPKKRDEVMQRVRQNFQMKEEVERADKEDRSSRIANLLESNNGDIDKIPVAEWQNLKASERSSWRQYASSLRDGTPIKTDPDTYLGLVNLAATDEDAFIKTNLSNYKSKLGFTELKKLADDQAKLRKKGGAADEARANIQQTYSNKQMVEKQFEAIGGNVKKDDERLMTLSTQFDSAVNAEVKAKGRKLTSDEKSSILNELTKEVVLNKRPFWSDKKVRAFEIKNANPQDIDIEDIPADISLQIKSHPSYKKNPTPQRMQEMYLHYLKKQGK